MTQPASNPASLPVAVDLLTAEVLDLFAHAEQILVTQLAALARRGLMDAAGSAQLLMLAQMRTVARRLAAELQGQATPLARDIITVAARDGDAAALAATRAAVLGDTTLAARYLSGANGVSGHALTAATSITLDLEHALDTATHGILRFADDAYRAAVAEAATRLILGRETTPAAAQRYAWTRLMNAGVSGYTDTAGRRWNLASYVEMATRTAVARAYNASHLARMTAVGIRYFTVSHDGHPCPLCRPWEGAVLGERPGSTIDDAANGSGRVRFTVAATVDEARTAGLFHPLCRHVLVPYLPGVTQVTGPQPWTAADQARYDATQRLRALERGVRAARRQEAGALTDLARRRARRTARGLQTQIRAHVHQHNLVRRPARERLTRGG